MSETTREPGGPDQWHVGAELLTRYRSGALDLGVQSAIEAHVTGCATCRATAASLGPEPTLDRVWQRIAVATSAPRLPAPLRWGMRVGLPETDAVLLRASSTLHRPWLLSLLTALVFAAGGAMLSAPRQQLFYLLIAPLLPALSVAAAYDATDPMRELAATTPFSTLRIALLRSGSAVLIAMPVALAVGLLLPSVGTAAFVWLLPALTLTVVALDVLTWCSAPVTAGVVAGTWLCFVALLRGGGHLADASTSLGQTGFAVASLLGVAVLGIRLLSLRSPGDPS